MFYASLFYCLDIIYKDDIIEFCKNSFKNNYLKLTREVRTVRTVADILTSLRQIVKLYEAYLEETREKYHLSLMEIRIISFLANNPDKDTVGHIASMRILSKGNVSRGADSLIQKGLLEKIPDKNDRREVHLHLLPQADPIIEEIEKIGTRFQKQLFRGFTQEEYQQLNKLNDRFFENVIREQERGRKTDE